MASSTDKASKEQVLSAALSVELTELGFVLDTSKKRGRFERGGTRGVFFLDRGEDAGANAWQLRACIYRKRDENVCQSSCNKLI